MGIEELKTLRTQFMGCVQGQMGNLENVNAKQLGEVVDMVKDLTQSIYYQTITQAMQKSSKDQEKQVNNINYYTTPIEYNKIHPDYYRDWERNNGYMYYPGGNSTTGGNYTSGGNTSAMRGSGNMNYYTQVPMGMVRDPREGRSALRRRMYMEGKQMHKDANSQLKELEAYLHELTNDITEMIKDASPEQRATLHQKMTTLANKIA